MIACQYYCLMPRACLPWRSMSHHLFKTYFWSLLCYTSLTRAVVWYSCKIRQNGDSPFIDNNGTLFNNTRLALFYSYIIHCISFVRGWLPRPLSVGKGGLALYLTIEFDKGLGSHRDRSWGNTMVNIHHNMNSAHLKTATPLSTIQLSLYQMHHTFQQF